MENFVKPTHYIVEIFGVAWWTMNFIFIFSLLFILYFTKNKNQHARELVGKIIAIVMFINFIQNQLGMYSRGNWDFSYSLPLEMCSISIFLGIIVLTFKNQFCYELLICWGAGAVHSFLTPEITTGGTLYNHIDYTISHSTIIISSIYATLRLGYTPRPKSWLKIFYFTQLILPTIGSLNFYLNSNYMYLREKPLADNPFLFGDWPYYILGLEFVGLAHFYLFIKLHEKLSKRFAIKTELVAA